jgi:hypothetical protein
MFQREVLSRDLSVDAAEREEPVVGLLMPLDDDVVPLKVERRLGHHALALLVRVEHHHPEAT